MPAFWPFRQSPSSTCHSRAAAAPTLQSPFPQEPIPPHPSLQPANHDSHWTWHRALQLIQQALHTGTHIFDPTGAISLWLFFGWGCSLPSPWAAALWDNIVRASYAGQWWTSASLIWKKASRKEPFRAPLHTHWSQASTKHCPDILWNIHFRGYEKLNSARAWPI